MVDSPSPPMPLTPESITLFSEGISLVLSQWTALQMAIQNEWGGRDSRQKSVQLASDVLSWFTQTKEPLYIDDLENMLFENMTLFFNIVLEDGSEEEVARELMVMHEECLQGNYESIPKLRGSNKGAQAATQSRQLVNEEDESSEDEEASDMVVDEQTPRSNRKTEETSVIEQRLVEAEDGWSVVPPRRNKGPRALG